ALAGADLEVCSEGAGRRVTIRPGPLAPFELVVPGDPSQAAFWVVAACCVPGSEVVVESIYLGPARGGFLEVLHRMGADVEARRRGGGTVDLVARYGPLQGTDVTGEEVPGLVDEIPVLAVAAACAEGTTTFSGAAELRVKESDRIATTVAALVALGAKVEPRADGLVVHGGRLSAGSVDSAGDHRIAMAAAVAALVPSGRSVIGGWDAVATSYPAFRTDLDRLTERW
ncbi:MAG: 3-phosphoshikimate 1-carboxyvinyltransferase, partial [Acidimicrobiales bacterium]